ncbi:CsgE family curli-type amyloid fiber assembly protein [Salinimicrobium sp. GXAS 041]|uniref:CsgE family curli-type amyloid fiber assembly protein n=1 Tax=Salinimicrobium sp. GXAS 041 TaxID=3400806 RepID=UPI003C77B327
MKYTKIFGVILLLLPLGVMQTALAQNFNSEVEAGIIATNSKDGVLDVIGTAKNRTETTYSLRYELSVITNNIKGSNSSKNSQTGHFTLEPFETKELSYTSFSISSNSRTILLLLLYNQDDEIVGTDRIVYNAEEESNVGDHLSYHKKNEGIQLAGIVTDRTKTKPGKDFYGFFYQQYSLGQNQGNKLIEIDEVISFGRTTKIIVRVEDKVVYQFFARPKLDYLKEQADVALRQVNRYFEYLDNRNEYITQY